MPPLRPRKLEPHVVLNDIFKNKSGIAKRKNIVTAVSASWSQFPAGLDKKVSNTSKRTINHGNRSTQDVILLDKKTNVSKPLIHCEPTEAKVVVAAKSRGRPFKVKKEVVVSAILKKRDDILRANGKLVPPSDTAWVRIKDELENKLSVRSLYNTAKREDVYEMLSCEKQKDVSCVPTVDTAEVTEPTLDDNNTMGSEHAVSNLVKTIDALTKEIKELRKELHQRNKSA